MTLFLAMLTAVALVSIASVSLVAFTGALATMVGGVRALTQLSTRKGA